MTSISVEKLATLTGHESSIYGLSRSQYSNIFFSAGGEGYIVYWDQKDPETGVLIAKMPNSVYALTYHPASSLLVGGHNYEGVHFFDWEAKKEVGSLKFTDSAIFSLASYNDLLFAGTAAGELFVIDVEKRVVERQLLLSDKSLRSMDINEESGELALGLSDNTIRILDILSFKEKYNWQAHGNSVFKVKYDVNRSRLMSVARDACIKTWNSKDYSPEKEVIAHMYAINSIDFSPDNKHFVTCSMDKTLKVWDAEKLDLLKVIDKDRHGGHLSSVNSVIWSEYNEQIISASDDRTISLWKIGFNNNLAWN